MHANPPDRSAVRSRAAPQAAVRNRVISTTMKEWIAAVGKLQARVSALAARRDFLQMTGRRDLDLDGEVVRAQAAVDQASEGIERAALKLPEEYRDDNRIVFLRKSIQQLRERLCGRPRRS